MFKDDFVWGVASSSYQIEGRDSNDGYGDSIWDEFTKQGKAFEGQDASISCDHIHRYKEDYALMRLLGIKAYRFSLSWSRIMPNGTGEVNQKAIDLYRDMILEMKKNNIEPYITLYHWELPQALQDRGGWLNKDIVDWFAAYAKVVALNFSDICEYFITLNEPQCFVGLGHLNGVHAPGLKLPYKDTFLIAHHAMCAHGKAVIELRKNAKNNIKIGYAPTCGVAYPATEKPEDIEAARKVLFSFNNPIDNWTWNTAWFSDPVFLGSFPKEGLEKFAQYLPLISKEDIELISQPLDFMGQNIYNGYMIRQGEDGEPEFVNRPPGFPRTAIGWPITPECLYWGVRFLYERYQLPIYITENGMSCHDYVSGDGRIHDPNRIDFLERYISALQKVSDDGADVRGYFLWTFMDNFEWDKGYQERFGIVHVDFTTQKRIVKDSAFWYQEVIETNGRNLVINHKPKPILFLKPVFKQMIWGGNRLNKEFQYEIPGDDTGECWAVSAHPNGDNIISEGIYQGKHLSTLWKEEPELFGNLPQNQFPLLVKIIDAKSDLSIQVHPNNEYARLHENGSLGKTECWYILDCIPNSTLVVGHKASSRESMETMIRKAEWKNFIMEIPIKKGDFVQIDPGTIHAIKGGIMLLEIQQSSDITYRVYDYDRLVNGVPRELSIEKSIDVIQAPAQPVENLYIPYEDIEPNLKKLLFKNGYYRIWRLDVQGKICFNQQEKFLIVSVLDGDGLINGQYIKKGTHFILPFEFGRVELQGNMELILSSIPED